MLKTGMRDNAFGMLEMNAEPISIKCILQLHQWLSVLPFKYLFK